MTKKVKVVAKALLSLTLGAVLLYFIGMGIEQKSVIVSIILGIVGAIIIYRAVDTHVSLYKSIRADFEKDKSWANMRPWLISVVIYLVLDFVVLGLYVKSAYWIFKAFAPFVSPSILN
jgi:hypothetical protein